MNLEEIMKRLLELEATCLHREGLPPNVARREARQQLLRELRNKGFKNFEAVYKIHAAEKAIKSNTNDSK